MKTIRTLRQERGWTQFELALRVGVQPQAVYFWESGRRTPQVLQLRKLGQIFGMCSDDIDLAPIQPNAEGSRGASNDLAEKTLAGQDGHGHAAAFNRESSSDVNREKL